jgi:hypothetical protein
MLRFWKSDLLMVDDRQSVWVPDWQAMHAKDYAADRDNVAQQLKNNSKTIYPTDVPSARGVVVYFFDDVLLDAVQ